MIVLKQKLLSALRLFEQRRRSSLGAHRRCSAEGSKIAAEYYAGEAAGIEYATHALLEVLGMTPEDLAYPQVAPEEARPLTMTER